MSLDASGNLYGTTWRGGANGDGTVWEIAKGSSTLTTLASFNGSDGYSPLSNVTVDANGNLFGATGGDYVSNPGTVWEIAQGSDTITTLASFDRTNGEYPGTSLALDAQGNLFGTTRTGVGTSSDGTVWEIQTASVPEPPSIVTGLIGLALTGGLVAANRARARRRTGVVHA